LATSLWGGTGIHKNLSHSQYPHFQVLKNLDKILAFSGFSSFSNSLRISLCMIYFFIKLIITISL
jgi:hypothetical protein